MNGYTQRLLTLLIVIGAVAFDSGFARDQHRDAVAIEDLLANRTVYDDSTIGVSGVLVLGFKQKNLYSSSSAAKAKDYRHCLGLWFMNKDLERAKAFDHKRVRVVGEFQSALCRDGNVCLNWCRKSGIIVSSIDPIDP